MPEAGTAGALRILPSPPVAGGSYPGDPSETEKPDNAASVSGNKIQTIDQLKAASLTAERDFLRLAVDL